MKNLFVCIFLFSLYSCNEPIIPLVDTTPKPWHPEIIWRQQHGPTKFDQLAFRIELYKNKLIAGYQSEIGSGYWIYDNDTGNLIKDIKNEVSFLLPTRTKVINNVHYSLNGKYFRTINLDDFNVTSFDLRGGNTDFNNSLVIIEDYVYGGYDGWTPPNKFGFYRNRIFRPNDPWSLFFEDTWDYIENSRSCNTSTIGGFKNNNNEMILYFVATYLTSKTISTAKKIRFQAYNITKNRMEWTTQIDSNNLDSDGTGNQLIPTGYDNLVIIPTSRKLRGFDKTNGKLVWEQNLKYITTTDYVTIGKHYFICDNVGLMYKIDMESGQIVSTLQLQNGNTGVWQEHKGIIYFTTVSGNLWAINSEKMEVKWKWSSENSENCSYCSFANNSPVVDKETDRLYITDGRDMFCIKLPE